MSTAITRLGDPTSCGDVMAQGSPTVFVEGLPVVRWTLDFSAGLCGVPATCDGGTTPSPPTVYVDGYPMSLVGDTIPTGCCGPSPIDTIANGAAEVFATH